jgi:hypothetical protein
MSDYDVAEALERESILQREDIDNLQNQVEDLKEENDRLRREAAQEKTRQDAYEESVVGGLNEKNTALVREVEGLKNLVLALRRNGGEHWFAFGYDKPSILGSRYARYCRVCDKEENDPSHFGNGVSVLSSTVVGEAVEAVRGRLEDFMMQHLKLGETPAREVVRDLLRGLSEPATPTEG